MRGTNSWNGSGEVTSIDYGRTQGSDQECATIMLMICDKGDKITRVRVNIYGGLVTVCRVRDVQTGTFVVITGELMNRGHDRIHEKTEVRASNIVVP